MANIRGVWGIDIGQCALKAIKLRPAEGGKVEVLAFDVIEHAKILSQPDADRDELVKAAIEKFASRNDLAGDRFVIGVPGHQTFARFCKLPPVEAKKIPEIVKFEASQQIPFPMADVVWDYEVFQAEDSPEVEVGIFAMRRDLIKKHLDSFGAIKIVPAAIQTIPSALYNFLRYEAGDELPEGTATVIVDVGAQHTDLIVVEKNSAWTRNIPLGGNNFTEALVKSFKLSFAKAESLKRTAATSKYARQIFQAMRPIFADLVAEIQRSLGFYSQTHREVELKTVMACGNAFLLPGLQKYLENNLTISGGVQKLEKFERMVESAELNAPQFKESTLSLGAAYGLAVQGLGLSRIDSNLLPPELARIAMWKKKQMWFAAAAAVALVGALMPTARTSMDMSALASNASDGDQARQIINQAKKLQSDYQTVASGGEAERTQIEQIFKLGEQRALVPKIVAFVHESLPEVDPRIRAAATPEALKAEIEKDPGRLARTQRKQIIIENFDLTYAPDIDAFDRLPDLDRPSGGATLNTVADPWGGGRINQNPAPAGDEGGDGEGGGGGGAGFYVRLAGRITYGGDVRSEVAKLLISEYYPRLQQLGRTAGLGFWVPDEDPRSADNGKNLPTNLMLMQPFVGAAGAPPVVFNPQGGQPAPEDTGLKDPVTGEDMSKDWVFSLGFKVKLGEAPAPEPVEGEEGADAGTDEESGG